MQVNSYINTISILKSALDAGKGLKYRILAEKLSDLILQGQLAHGEKLPTHRAMAFDLCITPGTVSKAYTELARVELVTSHVGSGTFVRGDHETPDRAAFRTYSTNGPETVDLSVNQAIPTATSDHIRNTLQAIGADDDALDMLHRYAPELGHARHRAAGAAWIGHRDHEVRAQDVICTNGGQHGLFCSLLAVVKPGGVVATESFTYPGLISACRALGIRLVGLAMDDEGLIPDALEAAYGQYGVNALYCTPTLQNPTTATMGAERLAAVGAISQAHNIVIIEDQAHAMLTEDRPPPLRHFAPDHTVTVAGLSKAIASGLRAGFVHAPPRLVNYIGNMVRSTCWMATPLPLEFAERWITEGHAETLLARQRQEIRRRKALVEGRLEGIRHRTHPDSPHFWIETPEPWRASEICAQLRRDGCLVASAEAFAVDRVRSGQFIRASVSLLDDDEALLLKGFDTLARVLGNPEGSAAIT